MPTQFRTLFLQIAFLLSWTAWAELPSTLPAGNYAVKREKYNISVTSEQRSQMLARAAIWQAPETPSTEYNFLEGELDKPNAFRPTDEVFCKWVPQIELDGATPKFLCSTANGLVLKIKYAVEGKRDNDEVVTEIVSSRLLRSLGFGADRIYTVKRVRCFGCPKNPWMLTSQMHSKFPEIRKQFFTTYGTRGENGNLVYEPNFKKFQDFTFVNIEQRMDGSGIKTASDEGWAWSELSQLNEQQGGAPRYHVEALALMAAFLQHSDNKPDNQCLVCPTPITKGQDCPQPMAIMQDVGGTLGGGFKKLSQTKLELTLWSANDLWKDNQCVVDISSSPTGSFQTTTISEPARVMVYDLLSQLSDKNLHDLF